MIRRFIVRARAERDIQSTFEWYESQQRGLGEEFLSAVRQRLETVRSFPESAPILYRGPTRGGFTISVRHLLCGATLARLDTRRSASVARSGGLATSVADCTLTTGRTDGLRAARAVLPLLLRPAVHQDVMPQIQPHLDMPYMV